MIVTKNGKTYSITEHRDKWKVKISSEKLSVAYDVSKKLCPTEEILREYIMNDDIF